MLQSQNDITTHAPSCHRIVIGLSLADPAPRPHPLWYDTPSWSAASAPKPTCGWAWGDVEVGGIKSRGLKGGDPHDAAFLKAAVDAPHEDSF